MALSQKTRSPRTGNSVPKKLIHKYEYTCDLCKKGNAVAEDTMAVPKGWEEFTDERVCLDGFSIYKEQAFACPKCVAAYRFLPS